MWKHFLFEGLNYGKIFSFPHSKNRLIHHLEVFVSLFPFFFLDFFFLCTKHIVLASFSNPSPSYFSGNCSRKRHQPSKRPTATHFFLCRLLLSAQLQVVGFTCQHAAAFAALLSRRFMLAAAAADPPLSRYLAWPVPRTCLASGKPWHNAPY